MDMDKNDKRSLKDYLKDKRVVVLGILLVTILVIGTSFALWQITLRQTDENRIVTSCLKLNFTEETNAITLNEAVPMSDEEGKNLAPYTFTITNTCNTKTKYVINLETVSEGEKVLADNFIKANLLKDSSEVFLSKLTTEHENQKKVITDANAAYMLDQGNINSNQSITYNLRLWIDSEVSNLEEMMNAVFASKITITAEYIPKRDTNEKILYNIVEKQAVLDNASSEFVTNPNGIDFGEAPSDTNGKGVYTIASTKDYYYPVHYFRGEVANNNVKFANICWKIVRTTETGGVKLIYNGLPNDEGGCTSTTGTSTQIGTSAFNSSYSSPADVGYMYGTRYTYNLKSAGTSYWYSYAGKTRVYDSSVKETEFYYGDSVTYDEVTNTYALVNATKHLWSSDYSSLKGKYTCFKDTEGTCGTIAYIETANSTSTYYINMVSGETYESLIEQANNVKWIYGNDVEYVDGKYVLKDTVEYSPMTFTTDYKTGFNAHRYTCFTTENSCTNVNYLYYQNYYIILKDGKKIEDALNEMLTESSNANNSKIKTTIDTWYQNNMTAYTEKLEDTVWCNDRSIYQKNGWDKDSTSNGSLYFGGKGRNEDTYKPSIECPNESDKFTVSSEVGNGKLTYPVALLTADEATLAGHGASGYSNKSYLYTNQWYWLLSPYRFSSSNAFEFYVDSSGNLHYIYVYNAGGVRPSVSLAPGTMVSDGNGTANFPFEVFLPEE